MFDEPLSMPHLLQRAALKWGEREAVVDTARSTRLSWRELLDAVRNFASALIESDVRPGDRVAIWAPNTHYWMVAALGTQYIGAVMVPINTRYTVVEAADLVERTDARILVVIGSFLGTSRAEQYVSHTAVRSGHGRVEIVEIPWDEAPSETSSSTTWEEFVCRSTSESIREADRLAAAVSPDDIADILFTSGTTGRSKGVLATHRQTISVARIWGSVAEMCEDDRYLILSPFFHTFGYKAGFLVCAYYGATVLPMPVFDETKTMAVVSAERVTVLPGAPTIFQVVLDSPDRHNFDLTSLRVAVTGATTVPVALVERMQSELSFRTVITAYGLTETSGYVSSTRADDSPTTVATTCGRPIEGMEVRLSDAGELLVRGHLVMKGYLDDPGATNAAIDADGWLHTGDVATIDERGYIAITDRIKDMYITGGFNVYPAEIEQVIARIPGVKECAVVGAPDSRLGEVGKAYVGLERDGDVEAADVIDRCSEVLAKFKVPRSVEFLEVLPKNPSGKIDKIALRIQASDSVALR